MNMTGVSRIVAVGSHLPSRSVSSKDLLDEIHSEQRFGIPNTYLEELTGIHSRRFAPRDAKPSDMAILAGQAALDECNMQAFEIDMVLYCGIDRDWVEPATSHRIQRELGCVNATCLDITNACHGFANGMSVGDAMIATGAATNVLVVTGEVPSHLIYDVIADINSSDDLENFRNKVGGFTTGDAGGAVILQRAAATDGIKQYRFDSRGRYAELCFYNFDENGKRQGQMLMEKISAAAIHMHKSLINDTYRMLDWTPTDVDYLICHQAGMKVHQRFAEIAGIELERAPSTLEEFGNLTSASIPVTLKQAGVEAGSGKQVLVLGSGSGLSVSQIGMVM